MPDDSNHRTAEDRLLHGAVYTPPTLALWVAELLAARLSGTAGTVLDPACGDGELLAAIKVPLGNDWLYMGRDISRQAIEAAQLRLGSNADLLPGDSLELPLTSSNDVQAIIMNPPWGVQLKLTRKDLSQAGFSLANGQYDSWDIFMEWAVKATGQGTCVAAIVPDAFFSQEHAATRRLLLNRTQIYLIARIGEGWFKGVSRGTCIIIFRNSSAPKDHKVQCVRVPKAARVQAMEGDIQPLRDCESNSSFMPQDTWFNDPDSTIDFNGFFTSRSRFKTEERGTGWTSWVSSGRGVEIGKKGSVLRCTNCKSHRPMPKQRDVRCIKCGEKFDLVEYQAIVTALPPDGSPWQPLIVGEDVKRFSATPSRWIRTDLQGLNYKSPTVFAQDKLLVRKTGLGINAAVDTSGSMTTQVVFHYLANKKAPPFFLAYLEGMLSSRAMLGIHLMRSGESEWRSHPYLTPSLIGRLPIPLPIPGTQTWAAASQMASLTTRVRNRSLAEQDVIALELEIDRLAQSILQLSDEDVRQIDYELSKSQKLLAFRGAIARARLDNPQTDESAA